MTRYAGALLALLSSVAVAKNCGIERWPIKTGTDPDARAVNLTPEPTTLAALVALPAPHPLPARRAPTELRTFVVDATLTLIKKEADSDYHLVLSDTAGHTMIAEIPDPKCVGVASPFAQQIATARAQVIPGKTHLPVAVRVTGVGFFDFQHHQTGVAPNAIELHPVLDIALGAGTAPPPKHVKRKRHATTAP